jgi:cytochrome c-type biogenesis protein CcmH
MKLKMQCLKWVSALALICITGLGPLQAKEAALMAEDPVVEKRLIHISEELRCLVCQNESLASSRAELANDLREEVRKLLSLIHI